MQLLRLQLILTIFMLASINMLNKAIFLSSLLL